MVSRRSNSRSAAVWLLIAIGLVAFHFTCGAELLTADEDAPTVRLVIDFGNGFEMHFTKLAWREGMTVLDVMEQADEHPFNEHRYMMKGGMFGYKGKGATAFLTSIDGFKNGWQGKHWIFRVNGELADRSFGIFPVKPNDKVLWKFGGKP